MVAVEPDAPADPLLVQFDQNACLDVRRIAAGNLAEAPELCREVFLSLDVQVPHARFFLLCQREVGENHDLAGAAVLIKGRYEALDRLVRVLQQFLDGVLSGSLMGEQVIHADDGMLKVGCRTT